MPQVHPILVPPPSESMAVNYFAPLMTPVPVATRLPKPDKSEDTVNGFLRVEAGGGLLTDEEFLWDVTVILHSYCPDEVEAERIICDAVAYGNGTQGLTIPAAGRNWYITDARVMAMASRTEDPLVNLPRYRAAVTWRVPGIQM